MSKKRSKKASCRKFQGAGVEKARRKDHDQRDHGSRGCDPGDFL